MTDNSSRLTYHQLSGVEQCIANRFSRIIGKTQQGKIGYPDDAELDQYAQIFRDFTLALYGIEGIEAEVICSKSLTKKVMNPCLVEMSEDPLRAERPAPMKGAIPAHHAR